MRKDLFIFILLLASFLLGGHAHAISKHVGRHYYFTLFASNHKYPIFSKEFVEGRGIDTVGGLRELWLDDYHRTVGIRIGFDNIRVNRSGIGVSLTYWRTEFGNEPFRYDSAILMRHVAEYRHPTHSMLSFDANGSYIIWERGWQGLGMYSIAGLVLDWEKYYIDKYDIKIGDSENSEKENLRTRKEANVDLRFAFGFGTRIYFSKRLSLWLEKRWIRGEKFGVERSIEQGGFYNNDQQKTLYSPINSLGFALAF